MHKKDFKTEMREHQESWKLKFLPHIKQKGWQNGKDYNHILPKTCGQESFFHPIQKDLFDFNSGYLKRNNVKPHTGIHNLLSSWTLCANMYWPFNNTEGQILLTGWFKKNSNLEISEITSLELEYEDSEPELKPGRLLGENNKGMRGSGQTSPDLTVLFTTNKGLRGILLIEAKFTEHNFYICSGYQKKTNTSFAPNHDKSRCHNIQSLILSEFNSCHLNSWGRKYWKLLRDDLDHKAFTRLSRCPMSTCCYQLFRQQALAIGYEKYYDVVASCVITDSRNIILTNSGKSSGMSIFPDAWKDLFPNLPFYWLTHNSWYQFVKAHNTNGEWNDWIEYIENRYDFS